MKKAIYWGIVEIILLLLTIYLSTLLFPKFNIYNLSDSKDTNVLSIRMLDEPDSHSYGNEMRIKSLNVNGSDIDMSTIAGDSWNWHPEWGYILFQDGNHVLDINLNQIKDLRLTYIMQEGSGKCEISLNGNIIAIKDMYSAAWKEQSISVKYLSAFEKYSMILEIWLILSAIVFAIIRALLFATNRLKDENISLGIGGYDFVKGIGILGVILGHSLMAVLNDFNIGDLKLIPCLIGVFLIYFLLPMFFMIGGIGSKHRDNKWFIKKQLTLFFRPYVIVSVLVILFQLIFVYIAKFYGVDTIIRSVLGIILMSSHYINIRGIDIGYIGPIWFVVAFCFGKIILNFILVNTSIKKQLLSMVLLTIVAFILVKYDVAVFCLGNAMMATIFLYIGYLLGRFKLLSTGSNRMRVLTIVGILTSFIFVYLNGFSFDIASNYYGRYFLLGVFTCTIGGICFLRELVILGNWLEGKAIIIKKIGRASYFILFLHTFECLVFPWNTLGNYLPGDIYMKTIGIFVCRLIVIYVLYLLVMTIFKKDIKKMVG